jgi:rubrerythrin
MDIRKLYHYALQREYEGKRFFEESAERLSHAAVVGAFKQLAAEEQRHIEFIQGQISALDEGLSPSAEMGARMDQQGFFWQRAATELLDQSVLEAMVPDLPALRTAYLIERDFAEFYGNAAREAEGESKKVLEMLARWEHGHELLFKQMHDMAFEQYAHMPWGG